MITISLCMIVKNEELSLDNALSSIAHIVDEIIIVDTGSTDATKKVAASYTDKIYDFPWCDDFSKARNYAFSKASCEYCMWLDADDILKKEDQEKLLNLKKTLDSNTSVVMLRYHTAFDDEGNPTFTYYRERIMRRSDNFKWQGFIHEVITPRGKIVYSDIAITHNKMKPADPKRNLRIFEKKKAEGVTFSPREIFYYARELYYTGNYKKAIPVFKKYLKCKDGWKENYISACQFKAYCLFQLKKIDEAIQSLLESLYYDNPRAEICCDLGAYFYDQKKFEQAIYWYTVATTCCRDDTNGGFIYIDCYDYIPYIQLCVCYYFLQDYQKANHYNELAGKCKPNDESYLYNKKILAPFL